jgi:FemAB-related protein (PEP-CTERM system-associated)
VRVTAAAAALDGCGAYVASHPRATAYHQPQWLDLIGRVFGHQTRYLAAERDGRTVGVLPLVLFASRVFGRFGVSLPFVNYGGVLADDADAERALLDAAVAETQRAGGSHLELRHESQHYPSLAPRRHKVAMRGQLGASVEAQWQRLDRKVRNQVRKAERSGLTAVHGGAELLGDFYAVFAHNMRDLGTPVYSHRFFDAILATFPESTRVFVVRRGAQPVATSIVHWHRDMIEVPWASALREFNVLCPNVLLYWSMLQFAIGAGMTTFDFGRSTPDGGTYHFKRQWGAVPSEMVWEYWTADGRARDLSPTNPKFALAIRAWQRLPLRVATTVGPLIVRNIP